MSRCWTREWRWFLRATAHTTVFNKRTHNKLPILLNKKLLFLLQYLHKNCHRKCFLSGVVRVRIESKKNASFCGIHKDKSLNLGILTNQLRTHTFHQNCLKLLSCNFPIDFHFNRSRKNWALVRVFNFLFHSSVYILFNVISIQVSHQHKFANDV